MEGQMTSFWVRTLVNLRHNVDSNQRRPGNVDFHQQEHFFLKERRHQNDSIVNLRVYHREILGRDPEIHWQFWETQPVIELSRRYKS
jgi:hypothetical protein